MSRSGLTGSTRFGATMCLWMPFYETPTAIPFWGRHEAPAFLQKARIIALVASKIIEMTYVA